MKMKQKTLIVAVFLGLSIGVSLVVPPQVTFAQEIECRLDTPEGCEEGEVPAGGDQEETQTPEREKESCDPAEGTCCGDVKTSIISGDLCGESDSSGESGTVYKLLIGALNILTAGIGIAAVGGIGYGALLYTTAESKPDQTKKAIGIITNVVIGIAAYALMYVFLNFLIPGGVFS